MTDYSKLTVVKLKEELKQRGLAQTGLKAVLIARLVEADAQPQSTTDIKEDIDEKSENDDEKAEEKSETISGDPTPDEPITSVPDDPATVDAKPELQAEVKEATSSGSNPLEKELEDTVVPGAETGSAEQPVPEADKVGAVVANGITAEESQQRASFKEQTRFSRDEPETQNLPKVDTTETPGATQTSLNTEEAVEDSRKRKRRSKSPLPSSIDIAKKKARAEDGSPRITLREDLKEEASTQDVPMNGISSAEPSPDNRPSQERPMDLDGQEKPGAFAETPVEALPDAIQEAEHDTTSAKRRASSTQVDNMQSPLKTSPTDPRFKGLFNAPTKLTEPSSAPASHLDVEDRDIDPAVHPATSALYIRNLSRPMVPASLQDHLRKLAKPPNAEPAEDEISEFFLDSIKSHCLVRFSNLSAASRVRNALHDRVWPEDRTRKPLWIDFVPEEKLAKWIEVEHEATSRRGQAPKRWEVVYEMEGDMMAAYLQEADGNNALRPSVSAAPMQMDDVQMRGAPTGPRQTETQLHVPTQPRGDAGKGFKALDDLFKSTIAKPKLYYQPVDQAIADRRLEKLAQGRGGGRSDEMRRFTFDGDIVVDKGPEFGQGWRGGGRGRGGYGGPPPGRGGGGRYRGGDSWR